MQQRQPRLGDILDDYCPRERRLTNHVVVAMIGDDVKQTRCTTCDADHEYKHATIPRQRKKPEESALYAQVLAGVTPKRIVPPPPPSPDAVAHARPAEPVAPAPIAAPASVASRNPIADFDALFQLPETDASGEDAPVEENISHRRLIRAQLPRHEGQAGITRQATDFTIRQPNPGRPKRFGARPARGGAPFQGVHQGRATGNGNGNSSGHAQGNGNGNGRGPGGQRQGGRPQGGSRPGNRPGGGGGGRNRSR